VPTEILVGVLPANGRRRGEFGKVLVQRARVAAHGLGVSVAQLGEQADADVGLHASCLLERQAGAFGELEHIALDARAPGRARAWRGRGERG